MKGLKKQRSSLRRRGRRAGFSLVEVMMAAAVMVLAISTSIIVIQRALSLQDAARNITLAGQIMQAEMEKMRLKDWTVVSGYVAGPTTLTIDSVFTGTASVGNRFTLTRTVSTPQTDMRSVVLTAAWRAYDGRTVSRTMTTYYSRYGLYDYYFNNTGS